MKKLGILMAMFLALAVSAPSLWAADVDVYAEGAYTDSNLEVFIYADINGEAILSQGVKLTYDDSILTVDPDPSQTQKNEAVWYMGDGTNNEQYMDPDTGNTGEVVIIGGKLDTGYPLAGVTGSRVLLGKVNFDCKVTGLPTGDPVIFYGIGIELGKAGSYQNFVTVGGGELDVTGVDFISMGVEIHERGDANGVGGINVLDMNAIKNYTISGGDDNPWKDCNDDDKINVLDMNCVKFLL